MSLTVAVERPRVPQVTCVLGSIQLETTPLEQTKLDNEQKSWKQIPNLPADHEVSTQFLAEKPRQIPVLLGQHQ